MNHFNFFSHVWPVSQVAPSSQAAFQKKKKKKKKNYMYILFTYVGFMLGLNFASITVYAEEYIY